MNWFASFWAFLLAAWPGFAQTVPINASAGWSDSPFISRDGKRLYFMYSRYNFAPWIRTGDLSLLVASGPMRAGLHTSVNPFDESDYYVATKRLNGTWSNPAALPFNGAWGDSSGMEWNGANTFVWLRGDGSTNHIVFATKNASGVWSAPVDAGPVINLPGYTQDNPYVSPDGLSMVFTSTRPGNGGKDLWWSYQTSPGTWLEPVNLGAPVNSGGDEDQFWMSQSSPDVYWNSPQGISHCLTGGGAWCTGTPNVISFAGCAYPGEISMPDDGKTLYFACVDAGITKITIMYSNKQSDGSWGPAIPVD